MDPGVSEMLQASSCEELDTFLDVMNSCSDHDSYLLSPVSAELKSSLTRGEASGGLAQLVLQLATGHVALQLSAPQYQDILGVLSSFAAFRLRAPHARLRPDAAPKQAPRAWWQYAINSLIADRKQRFPGWEALLRRKADREQYISLFRKIQDVEWLEAGAKPSESNIAEFDALEDRLSVSRGLRA